MTKDTGMAAEPVTVVAQRIIAARASEVAHYATLYPLLLAEVDEIMAEWDRATDQLPWSLIKASEKENNLAGVITRVIDCAMSSEAREVRVEAMIKAALGHGVARRKQEIGVHSLFAEYDILRSATWRQLQAVGTGLTSFDAIFVIDGLLSIATRATILGYHRDEMEANGLFEKQRAELGKTVRS